MVSSLVFIPGSSEDRHQPEPVFLVELQQGVGISLFNLGSTDRLVPWWEGSGDFRKTPGASVSPTQEAQQHKLTFVT